LAASRLKTHAHTATPILLLDEVVAHLDARRRLHLFDEILKLGMQTWMTGTEAGPFLDLNNAVRYFEIVEGALKEYKG
jgi:DNA replication and repair protein RecF